MIFGQVNEHCEAVIHLVVRSRHGQELETEVVVDTGYNGYLTLSPSLISELRLLFLRRGSAVLADGQETTFEVYDGAVLWGGELRRVVIDAVDSDPLIGMALLYGQNLAIQVIEGGTVSVSELPPS